MTEWDSVEDITVAEIAKFNLEILPYFFDKETAKCRHVEFVYLGVRPEIKR
jgi:hypothetical protein